MSDVMADFDNDGDVDGVNLRDALQANAVRVQVRRQTSPGAWSAEPAYTLTFPEPIGAITRFYALDLDGDSDIDITFAGKMLLNDGTGNFTVGSPVSMPANLGTLVNLDGDSDLESVALSPTDNIVRVYDLTAPATFTIISQWSVAAGSMMQVGRIDSDSRPDVVTWTRSATGTVDVRLQQQDGTFTPANVPPGEYFDFADFTGDGLLDGISFDRRTMRFGTADGRFSLSRSVNVPEYMRSADFDGDGRADLLYVRNPISQFLSGTASVYFALSDPGTFSLSQSAPAPYILASHTGISSLYWSDVRDINLDGRADLDYSSPLRAPQIGLLWYTLVDTSVQISVAIPPQSRLFDGDVSTFVLLATGYSQTIGCELYIDSNDNGLPDQEDLFYAYADLLPGAQNNLPMYSFPIGNSLGYGTGKILVVNRSKGIAYTSFTVEHWSRQFSAEGFKSSTVNEHIALVNYRDFGVPYEIVVYYEDGTNEIVNRGTLAPHRRDGFSTSLSLSNLCAIGADPGQETNVGTSTRYGVSIMGNPEDDM
ncbi:MAG TPA: VCBS repeat-containing protein, partial [Phycisphaerales bacterium]|nr:VCBS repeat-containing protein [Phycisphaerales bacterium]